jgi:hypothetical protein
MIAMLRRCSFGSKGQHDVGTISAEKEHDLADESLGIDLFQDAVAMTRRGERRDSENSTRDGELAATTRSQLDTRRNGDTGALAGIPVGSTKQIDPVAERRELCDRPAGAERLVIRVGENAAESAHGPRR